MGKYFDRAFGFEKPEPTQKYLEPEADTWLGRRVQDITGRSDTRYKDVPLMSKQLGTFGKVKEGATLAFSGSDEDLEGLYKNELGDRYIRTEKDAGGYPMIVFKGQDGKEQRGYINKPTWDYNDVRRIGLTAAPFMAAAKVVGGAVKTAPWLQRAGMQALGAVNTSLGLDAAGKATGLTDPTMEEYLPRAGLAAGGAVAGEALGAGVSAFGRSLAKKNPVVQGTTLTPKGQAALQKAGVNADDLTEEALIRFRDAYAKSGDIDNAIRQADPNGLGIPKFRGEILDDSDLLLKEQRARTGGLGEDAKNVARAADELQAQRLKEVVTREIPRRMAPGRQMGGVSDSGAAISEGLEQAQASAKAGASKAWEQVSDIRPDLATLDELGPTVSAKMDGLRVTQNTPQAMKMSSLLKSYAEQGDKFSLGDDFLTPQKGPETVDAVRRELFAIMKDAAPGSQDALTASKIYSGFDDFIEKAAMNAGDPMQASKLLAARSATRGLKEVFGKAKGSRAKSLEELMKYDSVESLANALVPAPGTKLRPNAMTPLRNSIKAARTYLPKQEADDFVKDLRLAVYRQLVLKKDEITGALDMSSKIKNFLSEQRTLAEELFTQSDLRVLKLLQREAEQIARKNPNKSMSGMANSNMVYSMLESLVGARIGRAATGVMNRVGSMVSKGQNAMQVEELAAGLPRRYPKAGPSRFVYPGVGATLGRDQGR